MGRKGVRPSSLILRLAFFQSFPQPATDLLLCFRAHQSQIPLHQHLRHPRIIPQPSSEFVPGLHRPYRLHLLRFPDLHYTLRLSQHRFPHPQNATPPRCPRRLSSPQPLRTTLLSQDTQSGNFPRQHASKAIRYRPRASNGLWFWF